MATRDVPVLLLAYNRPETTAAVFRRLREVRPRRLLISVDGPRSDVSGDQTKCEEVREIVSGVDWICDVSTRMSQFNAGCRYGPSQGIDWAFTMVDELIILEDDCLPDFTFFRFSAELLERYRQEKHVMGIGGHRWEGPDLEDGDSYFFSRYPTTWGWATWADRWDQFDVEMSEWRTLRDDSWLEDVLKQPRFSNYWRRIFDAMLQGLDAWDYAWLFSCWRRGGLSIRPSVNLVANLGFGETATHTRQRHHPAARPATRIRFPLQHPQDSKPDEEREAMLEWVNYSGVTTRQVLEGARRIRELRVRETRESDD